MAPINDEEAVGRTLMIALKSPIITSAISLLIGGAGGNYYANKGVNAKLDTLTDAVRESKPDSERILFLEETSENHESRIVKLEQDTIKLAYVRRRVIGRGRE